MKPVFKIALKSFLFNTLSSLICFAMIEWVAIIVLSVVIQIILGIVCAVQKEHKQLGQGMLLGVGIFGLIGFSVCTIILTTTNI